MSDIVERLDMVRESLEAGCDDWPIASQIWEYKTAAIEIESLRQQLAEKGAEIERLKEDGNMPVKYYQPNGKGQVYAVYGASSINFADSLLEQLAEKDAEIEKWKALVWANTALSEARDRRELRQQRIEIAASQAREVQLQEDLENLSLY